MNCFAAKVTIRTALRYGLGKHVDAVAPEKMMEYLKVNRRLINIHSWIPRVDNATKAPLWFLNRLDIHRFPD